MQKVGLNSDIDVPSNGILWVAIESSNGNLSISSSTGGTVKQGDHTFGDGPDPYPSITILNLQFKYTIHFGSQVSKWIDTKDTKRGDYYAEVKGGPMTIIDGQTTRSTNNQFEVMVDLIYWSDESEGFDQGFDNALTVAEKIYDLFHITNRLNGQVRQCLVSIFPGDGDLSGTLRAIPIRVLITCDRVITQI